MRTRKYKGGFWPFTSNSENNSNDSRTWSQWFSGLGTSENTSLTAPKLSINPAELDNNPNPITPNMSNSIPAKIGGKGKKRRRKSKKRKSIKH